MDDTSEFAVVEITEAQFVPWPRIAAVAAMVGFSLPTFITGIEVYAALSPVSALWALFVGSGVVFVIGAAMGAIGARTHMSSYLLVRVGFGDIGAGLVNMAFMISLMGWFGVNINLFAEAASGLALSLFGLNLSPVAWSIIASICMTLTTFLGFRAINLLSTAMVPVLALVTLLLLWAGLNGQSVSAFLGTANASSESMGYGISAVIGAVIIGAIILPDITRFSRHWSGAVWTALIAYVIVQLAVMYAAVFAASATGLDDIIEIMVTLGLGLGAFVIVIAGSWALNALNLYSAILSTKATFPSLYSGLLTIGLGVVGVVAALLNILDYFIVFLWYLSVVFVPVAGVILVDYFVIGTEKYKIETLKSNSAFNTLAFLAWGIGAALALMMEEGFIPSVTGVAALDAAVLSAVVYLVLGWSKRKA